MSSSVESVVKRFCIIFGLVLVAGMRPGVAAADLSSVKAFDIAPQPVASALLKFSGQSGVQVMSSGQELEGKASQGVTGTLAAKAALERLLQGTGLHYDIIDAATIAIRSAGGKTSARARVQTQEKAGRSFSERFRVARVDQEASAGSASPPPLNDASSGSASSGLEEVIVTAQKYRQSAFDVPMSLVVIGGRTLQELHVTNIDDLGSYVPGLAVRDLGNQWSVSIRGMQNSIGQWALIGTYLDEADVTTDSTLPLNLDIFDLDRIEVLRGPQGTLYGEGSVGGTLRFITAKPLLDRFQMLATATALFGQYGAPGERLETVINTPLVDGKLGLRIASELDHEGGWVDQPAANAKNINTKDVAAVRIEGRYVPVDTLTIDAMEVIHRSTAGTFVGENELGTYTQVFNLTTTPRTDDNYNITNVTATWRPGSVEVVNSATHFTHYFDAENFGVVLPYAPPPALPYDFYRTSAPTTTEESSDELRISDSGRGEWRWTLGGMYRLYSDDTPPALYYYGLPGPPGSALPTPYPSWTDVRSRSWSAFGDTNYSFGHGLVLGAGARYYRDDESALYPADPEREAHAFTSLDPRFYVRYAVSADLGIYASAAKGFRSGGFNGFGYPSFGPEHVWTYELGTKTKLLAGRLRVDADVFWSNYDGYQVVGQLPYPPIPITSNASDMRSRGFEGNVAWTPVSNWTFGLSGDYVNARFVRVGVQDSEDVVGESIPAPRFQVTASVERAFRWMARDGSVRIDYTEMASQSFRNVTLGPWFYEQTDNLYLLNLNTELDWSQSLKLGLFAQNLLNDRGYLFPGQLNYGAPRERPRTFGVDFSVRFE